MPKISVIVPVYNAEKYLQRCVDSILDQTFTDFELLLIDDGSPDRSGEVCDEYAKKDSRIRVFHKGNGGVSSARQCGIDNAQGKYTIHVDPDDWVEPNMLQELYAKAMEDNADMVICDFYVNVGNNCTVIKQNPSNLNTKNVLREMFTTLHGSLCNKLIRKSCYSRFGISFPKDMSLCEDLFVVCSILKENVIVSYTSHAFYHYVQDANENSITKITGSSYEYDLMLLNRFSELLKEKECLPDCCNKFKFILISRAYKRCDFTSSQFKSKCGKYKSAIFTKDIPLFFKLKLYLSCIGFYNLMIRFDNLRGHIR